MARVRSLFAAFLVLAITGCSGARAPVELSGLWSAGPAACAAGIGVQFGADAIAAIYQRQRETLFKRPRYQIEPGAEDVRVRIQYELPRQPGGAYSAGAYGVLVLALGRDGGLRPESHNMVDQRTGSVRMRIVDDPALRAMNLQPCGGHRSPAGLRGRGDA